MRTMVAALAMAAFAVVAQGQYKQTAPPAVNPNGPPVQIIPGDASAPKLQAQPEASLDTARRMNRDEAVKLVKEHKAVWIDVRPKDQYDLSHIPGAMNIPLSELPMRWKDLPAGKFYVTYCA